METVETILEAVPLKDSTEELLDADSVHVGVAMQETQSKLRKDSSVLFLCVYQE